MAVLTFGTWEEERWRSDLERRQRQEREQRDEIHPSPAWSPYPDPPEGPRLPA